MTIIEILTEYRQDILNILEIFEYQCNTNEVRNSLINSMMKLFYTNDIFNLTIEDVTTDEVMQSGHILYEFSDKETKETYIQKF